MSSEWRVLYNGAPAEAVDDPTGAEYSFVLVRDGVIILRGPIDTGFTHEFRETMRERLTRQLEALDKPFISEVTVTHIMGLEQEDDDGSQS